MPEPSTDQTPPDTGNPDLLAAALGYASRGWRVLPVHAGEKRPMLKDWPTEATTDPKQVADWWLQWPDANIGVATGKESGFFVLDIDPKNGGEESFERLLNDNGALDLGNFRHAVSTGSGGRHLYFAYPDDLDFDITNSPGQLKEYPGLDVRGEGGQVLVPPSKTVFGPYSVELEAGALTAPPEWLVELLRPRPLQLVRERVEVDDFDRLRDYAVNVALPAAARAVAEAKEGSRNQTLNDNVLALAGIAAHDPDLLGSEVYPAMLEACRVNGLLAADGEGSFVATFDSAWQAGLDRPRLDWPPRDPNAGLAFGPQGDPSGLPVVNVSARKLNELVDEVIGNIEKSNAEEPSLFAHGSETVIVTGTPARTEAVDGDLLAYEADQRMHFVRTMPNGGAAVTNAPVRVVNTIMALPDKPFPRLNRISYTPYFTPSGEYVACPGYNHEARTFLDGGGLGDVLEIPSPAIPSVTASARALLSELLVDFPFVTDADRAHAWALMLLPFVRDMIDGPTPLHNIEAPTPGSGKGLLMKALLLPGLGGRHVVLGAGADNEEWEKKLVSSLRLSPQALVIDNVNEKITSGFLCTALTEPVVTSRLLGQSVEVRMPVRCAWVMTANNPRFSDEVARRTIRIRLDPTTEHPEDRTGFAHPDLLGWATERRSALVAACCTLVASWIEQGAPRPVATRPFGSFEAWQAVMAGLLSHIGIPGLLDNKAAFQATSDEESRAWVDLIEILLHSTSSEWSSSALADIVLDHGIPIELGTKNAALMMGRELSRQRDRWHRGHRFVSRQVKGKTLWMLKESS